MNKNILKKGKKSIIYSTGELIRTVENPGITRRIIEFFPPISNGLAVDLGCGEGWISNQAKNKGYHVIGLDIDKKMLEKAKKVCDEVLQYNCQQKLPFPDNYFDLVICCDLLEHLHSPEFILNEIYRVLKFDGTGVIKIPNGKLDFLYLFEGHVRFITMKKILEWFKRNSLKVIKYRKFAVIPVLRLVTDEIPQFFVFQIKKIGEKD